MFKDCRPGVNSFSLTCPQLSELKLDEMAPYNRPSLWDDIPTEIKTIIISKSDIVTRFLNNDMSVDEIGKYGNRIWRLVFEWNLVDIDLRLLPPPHLPTIHNGLRLVKSKQMYEKLCMLRPDLIKSDLLKSYLESNDLWLWINEDVSQSQNSEESLQEHTWAWVRRPFIQHRTEKNKASQSKVSNETVLTELSSALINIVLCNEWNEELPSWWLQNDNINHWPRVFFIACCLGHIKLAKTLCDLAFRHFQKCIGSVVLFALTFTTQFGNRDAVAYLLSLRVVDPTSFDNQPLRNAFFNHDFDILKMLLDGCHIQFTREKGFEDIFTKACQHGDFKAVEYLLGLQEYFPTLPESTWRQAGFHMAVGQGRFDIIRLLLESGKGFDTSELCNGFLWNAALSGNMELVRLLAAVERVDLAVAQSFARRQGHTEIVEFLTRL
ncbi:hypothetical protein HDU76_008298 [Blyttiomyces sp. JEL0837]|nr:hypothetical protein HDU76_008298 [Blyttiomyces sp. JEL0837]